MMRGNALDGEEANGEGENGVACDSHRAHHDFDEDGDDWSELGMRTNLQAQHQHHQNAYGSRVDMAPVVDELDADELDAIDEASEVLDLAMARGQAIRLTLVGAAYHHRTPALD